MIKSIKAIKSIVVFVTFGLATGYAAENLTAYEIAAKVDSRPIPVDQKSEMTMNLISKKGKVRSRKVKTNRVGDDKQIMWFLEPADVKGSSFLRISYDDRDDDMWIYLPAFGKVRRIASHARSGSFMGSDFTYENMSRHKLDDFEYTLLREEEIGDKDCWVLERKAKEGVTTDYSKIIGWVWKEHFVIVKNEFFDKKGNLIKVMSLEVSQIAKYWIPDRIEMKNLKSGHRTELVFQNNEVDTGIDDNIFKSSYMTRIH